MGENKTFSSEWSPRHPHTLGIRTHMSVRAPRLQPGQRQAEEEVVLWGWDQMLHWLWDLEIFRNIFQASRCDPAATDIGESFPWAARA